MKMNMYKILMSKTAISPELNEYFSEEEQNLLSKIHQNRMIKEEANDDDKETYLE